MGIQALALSHAPLRRPPPSWKTNPVIFLLTNDDGIEAAGLQEFASAMRALGDVYVVAPDAVRSCCSHAVTTATELHLRQHDPRTWSLSGTPTDCIRLALRWLGIQPDWILSGVNEGGNLGVDIHYSGTVAGAREGRLLGYRSMALSQYLRRDRPRDWKLTAQRAKFAFEHWNSQPIAERSFWNINLPVVDHDRIELETVQCEPEGQMLHYHFERVDPPGPASGTTQPLPGSREPAAKPLLGDADSAPIPIVYRSNYQLRPRSEGTDVATCFAGSIVATSLSVDLK
jgi:5'-nucleotidase